SSLEANPGNPALCLSVSQLSQVTDGNICGPNGENGVYHPVTGGTINSTRGPFGPAFSRDGYFMTIGQSSYNSLQLSLRQRIKKLTSIHRCLPLRLLEASATQDAGFLVGLG